MRRQILIADPDRRRREDIAALLEADYHQARFADGFEEAEAAALDEGPAIVIASAAPGLDALALCRSLRSRPETGSTPVIVRLPEGLSGPETAKARLAALEAGADDAISPSFSRRLLLSRIRSLNRVRNMSEELAEREATARRLGLGAGTARETAGAPARVLVLAHDETEAARLERRLAATLRVDARSAHGGLDAIRDIASDRTDALLVVDDGGFEAAGGDAVEFIRVAATLSEMRHAPILFAADARVWSDERFAAALDAGAVDGGDLDETGLEIALRLRAQLRRKSCSDALRAFLDESLRDTALDPLTGLYNRRYFDLHASRLHQRSRERRAPLSAVMFDLDQFKSINDRCGHAAGDEALRAFALRLRTELRGEDFACRYGGDEFAVLLPGALASQAIDAADRVRRAYADSAASLLPGIDPSRATVSAGVADVAAAGPRLAGLLDAADGALRAAKATGRDCVKAAA